MRAEPIRVRTPAPGSADDDHEEKQNRLDKGKGTGLTNVVNGSGVRVGQPAAAAADSVNAMVRSTRD